MLGSLRREERPSLSSSAAPFCSPGSSSSSDSIRSEAWRNALFSAPMLTKAAWIPGSTASTVPRWMSPTMRRASGRSTRSSARRSSSRMATRVSRGLPLIRISRFKARSLDAGRPTAAGRPVIDPTRVLPGRGRRRCDGPEQPIGLEESRSPMHTLNLSGLATYVNSPEINAVPARRHAPDREGLVLAAMLVSGAGATPAAQTIQYPPARTGDLVDDYHGTKVPDPYRWLEDVDAPETRAWIEAENRVTDAYLAQIGGRDRPDHLKWVKFSDAAWTHDGVGFFYSRYPEPAGKNPLLAENRFQKLYYHRLGTDQSQDMLVYERPEHPDWGVAAEVTHDGRYAILSVWLGTDRRNRVYYLDLRDAPRPRVTGDVVRLLDDFDASYGFIGNDGPVFYFVTDLDARRPPS